MLKIFMDNHGILCSNFKTIITKEYYLNHPKYCKYCGKELSFEQRNNDFCNHSCAASYNNQGICRNVLGVNGDGNEQNHIITVKQNVHCLYCGKEISHRNKFCNSECQSNYNYNIYISNWKNGLEDGKSGKFGISKYIRRYLFEKYNSSC